MLKKALLVSALVVLTTGASFAQTAGQSVTGFLLLQGQTYGTYTCPSTQTYPCFVQYGSSLPVTVTPSGTQDVNEIQVGGVTILRGAGATGTGSPRETVALDPTTQAGSSPQRTVTTLDVKTVTTGGTAVNALSAGHRTYGGFLQNPIGASVALCINEIGTASGTTSSGDTTCIQPGQSYVVAPSSAAVSVVTSDSSHPFSGYGLN